MTLSERQRWAVRAVAGRCPHADCGPANGPHAAIYRASRRSVTMRCPDCGLLWTVTVHQMAKAARRIVDNGSEYAEVEECDAQMLERWAAAVPEPRGRRRRSDVVAL